MRTVTYAVLDDAELNAVQQLGTLMTLFSDKYDGPDNKDGRIAKLRKKMTSVGSQLTSADVVMYLLALDSLAQMLDAEAELDFTTEAGRTHAEMRKANAELVRNTRRILTDGFVSVTENNR